MKRFLTFFLLTLSISSYSQDNPYESWDNNYKEVDFKRLIKMEIAYADSVENNPEETQFFVRQEGYRFEAIFTGNWRNINQTQIDVMKKVYKLFSGNSEILDTIKKEVEIKLDSGTIWMPIQPILEKPFKKEVKKNSSVYLYTLFFNMHTVSGELYNIFLISEFINGN
ncbi:MAG: hypothetical protein KDC58_06255 [Cyclobacteriaceae bacterium]|nr:hypothetical protein [Cyclobacteriaceae bacterium]